MKRFISGSCVLAVLVLVGLAGNVQADPVHGMVDGVTRVPANGSVLHEIWYNGNERADFGIVGDGDTTLNIVVRDANGREVIRTRGPGDRANVNWTPPRTGLYFIHVINEGNFFNKYNWMGY